MGFFTRLALFLFLLRAHLGRSYSHNTRHKGHHAHSIFVDSPRRFNRGFLEVRLKLISIFIVDVKQYARKSVDEFNKQSSPEFRYTLLGIIGAKANEETKSLEIMARFGRTRCQRVISTKEFKCLSFFRPKIATSAKHHQSLK